MTRKRKLRQDELELWTQVARTATPLARQALATPEPPAKKPDPASRTKPERPPISPFSVGQSARIATSTAVPMSVSERLAAQPLGMDAKAHARLRRGKLAPEARIDLHGMTLDEAHPALVGFILRAQARGLRLVLVITGKGQRHDPHDPAPHRRGILKQQVPSWLRLPPVGPHVLQVTEAHIRHGGSGAYYVYLRRRR